jgi:hypothetical protein
MLSTIILFNKSSSTANENEIFATFLQNLSENKICIKNNSSFSMLARSLNAFEKSIWLESKNFLQTLTLYDEKAGKVSEKRRKWGEGGFFPGIVNFWNHFIEVNEEQLAQLNFVWEEIFLFRLLIALNDHLGSG